jgi:hypothetical protein
MSREWVNDFRILILTKGSKQMDNEIMPNLPSDSYNLVGAFLS